MRRASRSTRQCCTSSTAGLSRPIGHSCRFSFALGARLTPRLRLLPVARLAAPTTEYVVVGFGVGVPPAARQAQRRLHLAALVHLVPLVGGESSPDAAAHV